MEIFYGIILLYEQWTISVIAESVWDPLSTTQTSRLVNVISKLGRDYPCIQANNKATQVGHLLPGYFSQILLIWGSTSVYE